MAGVAILIRPSLALLAAFPAVLILARAGTWRSRTVHAAFFAAGCAPFVATVAAVFNHLYGSPLRSGYGSLRETYDLANAALNMSVYPRSFLDAQGLAAFAFLLAPCVALVYRGEWRVRRLLYFFFVVAVFGCYLLYTSFPEWWYLRFLLPAFPFVFILGADAVSTLAVRFGPGARQVALILFGALIVLVGAAESSSRRVLREWDGERRYADAAAYVQAALPAGAVVLAMQHSGSLAYYSDKLPLRYDIVPAEWMDRAIESIRGSGRPVYVLLDDWEVPIFAERFSGQGVGTVVATQPIAVTADERVKLFVTESGSGPDSLIQMPGTRGCLSPGVRNLYKR